jgi:hypothetical protein
VSRSTSSPTISQRTRFQRIQELGCIACRLRGFVGVPTDIHHLLIGGERRGHDDSVGLCPWHHRSVPPGCTAAYAHAVFGPSMKRDPRAFRAEFGDDEKLLEYQNKLLGLRRA